MVTGGLGPSGTGTPAAGTGVCWPAGMSQFLTPNRPEKEKTIGNQGLLRQVNSLDRPRSEPRKALGLWDPKPCGEL